MREGWDAQCTLKTRLTARPTTLGARNSTCETATASRVPWKRPPPPTECPIPTDSARYQRRRSLLKSAQSKAQQLQPPLSERASVVCVQDGSPLFTARSFLPSGGARPFPNNARFEQGQAQHRQRHTRAQFFGIRPSTFFSSSQPAPLPL